MTNYIQEKCPPNICGFCHNNLDIKCAINNSGFTQANLTYYAYDWKCECWSKTCLPVSLFKTIKLYIVSLIIAPIKIGGWLYYHIVNDILDKYNNEEYEKSKSYRINSRRRIRDFK